MSNLIYFMIAGCLLIILILVIASPMRTGAKLILRAACGAAGIFVTNALLASFGVSVGINIFTLAVIAVLGLPGFAVLYAAVFILPPL